MVTDNGGAPCVWHGLLSLAICKPKIRSSASRGALIFGFGGKRYSERLLYIARVTNKPEIGDYYRKSQYARRPDCIYHSVRGQVTRKRNARYHNTSDQRKRDVGPRFESANVLLSDDFRYFGKAGSDDYKSKYPQIRKMVECLKRGHRVKHSLRLRQELVSLKADAWKRKRMRLGPPSDSDLTRICNFESPSVCCS
jgi:hypothetical protein